MKPKGDEQKAFKRTAASKKFSYHLRDVTKRNDFREDVLVLRGRHNIPPNGFLVDERGMSLLPFEWQEQAKGGQYMRLKRALLRLRDKYELGRETFPDPVELFIFYNVLDEVIMEYMQDLFVIRDFGDIDQSEKWTPREEREIRRHYPVVICISPYASGRDLKDFIQKRYSEYIEPRQLKYLRSNIKLGQNRKRNKMIEERDVFVYENRDTFGSRKELAKETNKRYGDTLIYSEVSAIISAEKKKRSNGL